MPKGVEHTLGYDGGAGGPEVPLAVMPKGVEHVLNAAQRVPADGSRSP